MILFPNQCRLLHRAFSNSKPSTHIHLVGGNRCSFQRHRWIKDQIAPPSWAMTLSTKVSTSTRPSIRIRQRQGRAWCRDRTLTSRIRAIILHSIRIHRMTSLVRPLQLVRIAITKFSNHLLGVRLVMRVVLCQSITLKMTNTERWLPSTERRAWVRKPSKASWMLTTRIQPANINFQNSLKTILKSMNKRFKGSKSNKWRYPNWRKARPNW